MKFLINLLIRSLAIFVTAHLLPGVHLKDFGTALAVAVVLGLINIFIRPVIIFLTLPINLLTLGLFTFIINAFLILLIGKLIPDFKIENFGWAVILGIVLWLVNWFLSSLT